MFSILTNVFQSRQTETPSPSHPTDRRETDSPVVDQLFSELETNGLDPDQKATLQSIIETSGRSSPGSAENEITQLRERVDELEQIVEKYDSLDTRIDNLDARIERIISILQSNTQESAESEIDDIVDKIDAIEATLRQVQHELQKTQASVEDLRSWQRDLQSVGSTVPSGKSSSETEDSEFIFST